jgi:hypothetical protein
MTEDSDNKTIAIPIAWPKYSGLRPVFVNQFHAFHGSVHEFVLTFGQLKLPLTQRDAKDAPTVVEVEPVVEIVMPIGRMQEFVDIIVTNWENYKKTHGQED